MWKDVFQHMARKGEDLRPELFQKMTKRDFFRASFYCGCSARETSGRCEHMPCRPAAEAPVWRSGGVLSRAVVMSGLSVSDRERQAIDAMGAEAAAEFPVRLAQHLHAARGTEEAVSLGDAWQSCQHLYDSFKVTTSNGVHFFLRDLLCTDNNCVDAACLRSVYNYELSATSEVRAVRREADAATLVL